PRHHSARALGGAMNLEASLREMIREVVREEMPALLAASKQSSNEAPESPARALSYRQAANLTGVCSTTLSAAVRAGQLRPARIGVRVVFVADDLQRWLEQKRDHGTLRRVRSRRRLR